MLVKNKLLSIRSLNQQVWNMGRTKEYFQELSALTSDFIAISIMVKDLENPAKSFLPKFYA